MTFLTNGPGEMSLGADDLAAALAELKAALNLVSNDDDGVLRVAIETGLSVAESYIGRAMLARDLTERLPASACWQALGAAPVRSIAYVSTIIGGTPLPLMPVDYAIDIDAEATGWVRVARVEGVIEVEYRAGWAETWGELAAPIRQGVVIAAGHLYTTRFGDDPPPMSIMALWRPFRAATIAGAARA